MSEKHGGPAFPMPHSDQPGSYETHPGMTLRDWFAGHAPTAPAWWLDLQRGLDKSRNPYNEARKPPLRGEAELQAAWRYEFAEAMLAARAKGEPS